MHTEVSRLLQILHHAVPIRHRLEEQVLNRLFDFGHLVAPKFHRDVSGALRGVGRRLLGLGKFLRSHEVIDAPERLVDHVDFALQCLIETFLLFDIWQISFLATLAVSDGVILIRLHRHLIL